jgi:hypothetical protein
MGRVLVELTLATGIPFSQWAQEEADVICTAYEILATRMEGVGRG